MNKYQYYTIGIFMFVIGRLANLKGNMDMVPNMGVYQSVLGGHMELMSFLMFPLGFLFLILGWLEGKEKKR